MNIKTEVVIMNDPKNTLQVEQDAEKEMLSSLNESYRSEKEPRTTEK